MFLRIVFMGTPEFAVPVLRTLADKYPIVGVVTQPDRESGRGRVLTSPPVKHLAHKLGLEVYQPGKLKDAGVFDSLKAWNPHLIVVAAFGQILRQNVLDLPSYGCVNVHASLLPRWRGAAPIQAAIIAGDNLTGVTIMKMDSGIDTGVILAQRSILLDETFTGGMLAERLASEGADLLVETLPQYLNGSISVRAQDSSQATYAPMLKKENGLLDFSQPVEILARIVRAYYPWPGTFMDWKEKFLKVLAAHVEIDSNAVPGKFKTLGKLPAVGGFGGWLVLDVVQPAGKKQMPGEVFLRGAGTWG